MDSPTKAATALMRFRLKTDTGTFCCVFFLLSTLNTRKRQKKRGLSKTAFPLACHVTAIDVPSCIHFGLLWFGTG